MTTTHSSQVDLTILVIATRNYCEYALQLLESAKEMLFVDGCVQAIVFTDKPEIFSSESSDRMIVTPICIPSYGWPNATLLRYHIFADHWNCVLGDVVAYLDADTRVVSVIEKSELNPDSWTNQIGLVQHPGYYRRDQWIDLSLISTLGPWETRSNSSAYVPLMKRRRYVCGGVWFGSRNSLRRMILDLREQTQKDLEMGVEAKWHDESHLNAWAARNRCSKLEPKWAFVSDYPHLSHLKPKIEVIHKPADWKREE